MRGRIFSGAFFDDSMTGVLDQEHGYLAHKDHSRVYVNWDERNTHIDITDVNGRLSCKFNVCKRHTLTAKGTNAYGHYDIFTFKCDEQGYWTLRSEGTQCWYHIVFEDHPNYTDLCIDYDLWL